MGHYGWIVGGIGALCLVVLWWYVPQLRFDIRSPFPTTEAIYICEGGKQINASFIGRGVKLSLPDGRELTLDSVVSASGSRYANRDESIVFWSKGSEAALEENGVITMTRCFAEANDQTAIPEVPYRDTMSGTTVCLRTKEGSDPSSCLPGIQLSSGVVYAIDRAYIPEKEVYPEGVSVRVEGMVIPIAQIGTDYWHQFAIAGIIQAGEIIQLR